VHCGWSHHAPDAYKALLMLKVFRGKLNCTCPSGIYSSAKGKGDNCDHGGVEGSTFAK